MKLKKLAASLLAAAMVMTSMVTGAFAAESKTTTVDVVKNWTAETTATPELPDPDDVTITVDGNTVQWTETDGTEWKGTVELPKETVWNDLESKIVETSIDNWELTQKKVTPPTPAVEGKVAFEITGGKVNCNYTEFNKDGTEGNSGNYIPEDTNLIIAKKGNNYYVLCAYPLEAADKTSFEAKIKEIYASAEFFYGNESVTWQDGGKTATLKKGELTFSDTNVWSMFDYGKVFIDMSDAHPAQPAKIELTNTYTGDNEEEPDKVYIRVEKEWKDEKGNEIEDTSDLPEVTVKLYADGNLYQTEPIHLNKDNDWYGKFYNLPRYSNGKEINYTVREDVPNGYTVSYECETDTDGNDVFVDVTITNTYIGNVSFPKYFKLINATADDVKNDKFTFTLTPLLVELRETREENTIKSKTVYYNDNGVMVTFDDDVQDGWYTLEENMPEGWTNDMPEEGVTVVVKDGVASFYNSDNDGVEKIDNFSVTNTYKKTDSTPIDSDDDDEEEDDPDLTVKKVDSETGKLITEKATFRIYKKSGSKTLYYTGSGWSSSVEKAKEYSTKNGKFTAYDLGAGTYYVEEVKAPSGYNLGDDLKVKLTSKDKTVEFANSKAKQNPSTGALVLPVDLADAAVAAMTLGAAAWVISKSKK